nr:hypothetical protein [Myxococcota bacterium]
MHRRAALTVAGLLCGRGALAVADDGAPPPATERGTAAEPTEAAGPAPGDDDPRALFGFRKPAPTTPTSCADGRTTGCATATDRLDEVSPYALRTWLTASYLLRLPVADSRHDGVAHYGIGASRDEAGPSFAGATGLENRWTIEGAPADNVRTGGVDTRVPLTFMRGMLVTAGGFAARDRTSTGGTIDVELIRGGADHEVAAHAWLGLTAEGRRRPVADSTYALR